MLHICRNDSDPCTVRDRTGHADLDLYSIAAQNRTADLQITDHAVRLLAFREIDRKMRDLISRSVIAVKHADIVIALYIRRHDLIAAVLDLLQTFIIAVVAVAVRLGMRHIRRHIRDPCVIRDLTGKLRIDLQIRFRLHIAVIHAKLNAQIAAVCCLDREARDLLCRVCIIAVIGTDLKAAELIRSFQRADAVLNVPQPDRRSVVLVAVLFRMRDPCGDNGHPRIGRNVSGDLRVYGDLGAVRYDFVSFDLYSQGLRFCLCRSGNDPCRYRIRQDPDACRSHRRRQNCCGQADPCLFHENTSFSSRPLRPSSCTLQEHTAIISQKRHNLNIQPESFTEN